MPRAVADKLISLQRRFLWSNEDEKDGVPLVRWDIVQAPKYFGGLGMGDAMLWNTALMFKCGGGFQSRIAHYERKLCAPAMT